MAQPLLPALSNDEGAVLCYYRRDRSLPRAALALIALIREHRKLAEPGESAAS